MFNGEDTKTQGGGKRKGENISPPPVRGRETTTTLIDEKERDKEG